MTTEILAASPAADIAASEQAQRVLLIEDDEAQARAMSRWLDASRNFHVTLAASGYAAEAYLKSGVRWDVVVTDIDLPGMSGLEVLRICKKHQPGTPVLMITAHRKFDYILEAMHEQADDFLVKPLKKEILQAKVQALIESEGTRVKAPKEMVLAIGAHPDDVEIGVGGTLLNHVRRGDEVTILTLTGGEAGGPKARRILESRHAAKAIGADLRMTDLPDRAISEGPDTISAIESVLREVKPTVVYTHSANDAHQDHRAVHRASVVAARGVPNIYCYQSPSCTVDFRPSIFINVTAQMERKLEVLRLYSTQTGIRPYLTPGHIRSTAEYWGRFSDYQAVEAFEVVRRSA
jgi:LmbE family N-acetylglucosaminyl deacetylase/CheY-like chemotaxis protein